MCVPPEQEGWSGPGEDGEDHRGEDCTELPDREVASLCDPPPAPPGARKQSSDTVFKMCPGFTRCTG